MTQAPTPTEIAIAYIEAWSRRDMNTVAACFAEDIVFEGPMAQNTGAATSRH